MAEPIRIKPEPGSEFEGEDEDELDEESTDLEFYDKALQGDTLSKLYLARLPAYLWQAWSELDEDEEIQIGKIRQWHDPKGGLKIQMLLSSDIEQHKGLPKEYNMQIQDPNVSNTFIFSEQDLPSYAAKNKERADALAAGIPAHLLRNKGPKPAEEKPAGDRFQKRAAPYTRRAIPKRTKIAGTVKHEVVCTPIQNAESDFFLADRAKLKEDEKEAIAPTERLPQNGVTDSREWESFLKTTDGKVSKAKKMENKTTRWAENQLLDEIARCFSEHKYWSIKALRGKIPQPEAFIRECLEKVAMLHRSGNFANNWSLRPEYQGMMAGKNLPEPANDVAAPKPGADLSDDDDDDIKMEDVQI